MRVKWSPPTSCRAARPPASRRRPRRPCSARRARCRRPASAGTAPARERTRAIGSASRTAPAPAPGCRRAGRLAVPPTPVRGRDQVEYAGLRDDPGERDPRRRAGRAAGTARPRRPHRQLTAGRVPDRDDPRGVDVELGQVVDPGRDVVERLRPAAAVRRPGGTPGSSRCTRARRGRGQRAAEDRSYCARQNPPWIEHDRPGVLRACRRDSSPNCEPVVPYAMRCAARGHARRQSAAGARRVHRPPPTASVATTRQAATGNGVTAAARPACVPRGCEDGR